MGILMKNTLKEDCTQEGMVSQGRAGKLLGQGRHLCDEVKIGVCKGFFGIILKPEVQRPVDDLTIVK